MSIHVCGFFDVVPWDRCGKPAERFFIRTVLKKIVLTARCADHCAFSNPSPDPPIGKRVAVMSPVQEISIDEFEVFKMYEE